MDSIINMAIQFWFFPSLIEFLAYFAVDLSSLQAMLISFFSMCACSQGCDFFFFLLSVLSLLPHRLLA